MSEKIKVMSMNLRIEALKDGMNILSNRKGRILETIRQFQPDVIGFQEAVAATRLWLSQNLQEYSVFGCGRNEDYSGEGTPIAIRNEVFELIGLESRWLSETPLSPGTRFGGDHSIHPRMYVKAFLSLRGKESTLSFVNTHLDQRSSEGRMAEAHSLIAGLHEEASQSLIITGDFNAPPDTPEIRFIEGGDPALRLRDAAEGLGGSYHGFGRFPEGKKIDYIFTNAPFSGSCIVEDRHIGGIYISDHRPIYTEIEIN